MEKNHKAGKTNVNKAQMPSVELIQGPTSSPGAPPKRGHRWKVFFGVLITASLIGAALVYSRAPVYRATASVLTVKPKAVDSRSAEADTEHVAIQSRLLLSSDLLTRLAARLEQDGIGASLADLQATLRIQPVAETNLLELQAEGADPGQLQTLVNRWTETYQEYRAEEIEAATGRTTTELGQQQVVLQNQIDMARSELQDFRSANEIVGLERGENASLAKLKGLNSSLSKARERLTDAQSRAAAVDAALAAGETVIPGEQKSDISKLKLALERARSQLTLVRQRYTQKYIDRDPALRELPGQVRAMERELAKSLALAGETVRDEAKQEVDAARLSVTSLEQQLAEHQANVQLFNNRFQEFKLLEANLERLDRLYSDNAERLAQIEMQGFRDFPQIQIVEWAREPIVPIYPDYQRDLLFALGIALGLALFLTWLFEYLTGRTARHEQPPFVGVRIQPDAYGASLAHTAANPAMMSRESARNERLEALEGEQMRETDADPRLLDEPELLNLVRESGSQLKAHITLLLSGVSPYELPLLSVADFDAARHSIEIGGTNRRCLEIAPSAWQHIRVFSEEPADSPLVLSVASLNERLRRAADDAGLSDARHVDAVAIWQSYLVYLLNQGIEMPRIEERVGVLPETLQAKLQRHASPTTADNAAADWTHPALLD
jgi:uncharacterized protein involved in exopolysaccharide biosynthesis